MKFSPRIFVVLTGILLFSSFSRRRHEAPDIIGAWSYGKENNKTVMIATPNVFSVATYDIPGKKMISCYGGTWKIDKNTFTRKIEWNSVDSIKVGEEMKEKIEIMDGKLAFKKSKEVWSRLDDGKPGELMGAWIITGNYRNDSVMKRASPFYPRRTMKVLSGEYFHWIAYNVETKSFYNAGGGTYTTVNGKYTENIEFFTKTPASVGKRLVFDYSFVNGDWRHKGEKSTGGPLDECWTRRESLER